jgi:acyl-CoA synthetase (AMP-forming)/AMP-acid ligase II
MTDRAPWPSIPAMLEAAAERFGEKLAIEDGQSRLTFAQLHDNARRFGAALVAAGVESGDRVAIWTFNSVEWVVAMLGTSLAGGVLVPINTRFKGGEAADILGRSQARVLVTVTDFLETDYVEMLRSTGVALPDLATTVVARGGAPDGAEPWDSFLGRAGDAERVIVDQRRGRTTRRTYSSRPARPGGPRAWSCHTGAPCAWPPTGCG